MLVVMALAAPVMVWLFMQVRAQQMNAGWFVFGTAAAIFGAHLLLWPIVAYRKGCYSMADREQQRTFRDGVRDGTRLGGVILLFALGYLGVSMLLVVVLG